MKVVVLIRFLLPARRVEVLPEIAPLIQQSNSNQRQSKITCRLQMVARQHAQASRENRQAFGDAEFGCITNLANLRDLRLVGTDVTVRTAFVALKSLSNLTNVVIAP